MKGTYTNIDIFHIFIEINYMTTSLFTSEKIVPSLNVISISGTNLNSDISTDLDMCSKLNILFHQTWDKNKNPLRGRWRQSQLTLVERRGTQWTVLTDIKGVVHQTTIFHSLSTHQYADGGVGEVYESTKHCWSFRGKQRTS